MARTLMIVGVVMAAAGALMHFGVPIGRLPGDVTIRRDHFTFSFPIVTCILISVVLTIVSALWRR